MKIKVFISSLRPRTLFLSASGIILGNGIAASQGFFDVTIFIFSLLTAIALQIISNLANELGDYQKGIDNQQRTGPIRSIQKGDLLELQLKKIMYFWIFCAVIFGFLLIYFSFDSLFEIVPIAMLCLGAFAILAALFYTLGKHAYGYHGFGDFFVWLFFGIVSVMGSEFLQLKTIDFKVLLPASSMGFLATAVLNLNNIRDIENDQLCQKNTVCVKIGEKRGKSYHSLLIIAAFILMLIFNCLEDSSWQGYLFFATLPMFLYHIIFVNKHSGKILDHQFPILVIGIFLYAILIAVGMLV